MLRLTVHGVCSRTQACRNEATKRSKKANPESSRRANAKREATLDPQTGLPRWRKRRMKILRHLADRQEMICPWCEQSLPLDLSRVDIDHIIPIASGVVIHETWNLQALHRSCNCSKRDKITPQAVALAVEHGLTLAA